MGEGEGQNQPWNTLRTPKDAPTGGEGASDSRHEGIVERRRRIIEKTRK